MENNLTPLQQDLVNGLIEEFKRINPKPSQNGSKRFTLETINDCIKEEDRFKETITKHNLTMMKVFLNQFKEELKGFKKEFGEVMEIQIGYNNYANPHGTIENLKLRTEENPLNNNNHYEMNLFIVSKKKKYPDSDNRWNYCNGKKYICLYVDFRRENIGHKLESGKIVSANKIVGLEYRKRDYLKKNDGLIANTLDELIQIDKDVQKLLVELVN